jgi:CarD family transcriptional regulator
MRPSKVFLKRDYCMADYNVGDNAVYAGHGIGKIISIETQEMYGAKQSFYRIHLVESDLKVLVPTTTAEAKGLRPIISKTEADQVMSIVQQKDVKIDNQTWNRRYREYMEKIKTGSVFETAEVFRDLFLLRSEKELSHGEKNMLDLARKRIFKELELCLGQDAVRNDQIIAKIFEGKN